MLTLADILKPRNVDLALPTHDPARGFAELGRLLETDPGMVNRQAFHAALKLCGKPVGTQSLLSHLRTDHVSSMLLAAGRMPRGRPQTAPVPLVDGHEVRFLFLIVVPMTLAAEYLQMVGALARSLRNPRIDSELWETANPDEFVRILCAEAAEI